MRVVDAGEILAALDEDAALAAVETGFRRYSAGQVQVSTVLHLALESVLIWARNSKRASALASEVRAEAVPLEDLCARADLIVTTTPSTEPLLASVMIRPGTRIVAVGADSPGKQELDPRILAR